MPSKLYLCIYVGLKHRCLTAANRTGPTPHQASPWNYTINHPNFPRAEVRNPWETVQWPGLLQATRGCAVWTPGGILNPNLHQESWEGIRWPCYSIFQSCWAISLRTLSRGNSLTALNHKSLGAATFLWGLVPMWNSEISCGAQHGRGNEIVGLIAHRPEVLLFGSQTKGLVFHSYPLTE